MQFYTDITRIVRSGFVNFWRNGVVSLASILVFTVTLFVIGGLVLGQAVFNATLEQIRDKVDVTVYFTPLAEEGDIIALQGAVENLPEVKEVVYLSAEEVLADFREQHAGDALILQSLDELGDENPLRAELNIRAHDPQNFPAIVAYLEDETLIRQDANPQIIDKVNFEDNRAAIERFTEVTVSVERLGLLIALLSAAIAVLVAFNTIRLAIYTSREEISVMRLVGAGNNYIRGPFIVEGILYGVVSALFTLALFYPITAWVSQETRGFFGGIDLFAYYISHFPLMVLLFVVSGIVLGTVSSLLAVRRYLSV